jgi:predicted ATPase
MSGTWATSLRRAFLDVARARTRRPVGAANRRRHRSGTDVQGSKLQQYLRSVVLLRDRVESWDEYPFTVPVVRTLTELELDPNVTFFIGENGAGKSTLLEAIATLSGFGGVGGSKDHSLGDPTHTLHKALRLVRGASRERDGFFLRAETYYDVGQFIDENADLESYGGAVHERSHGEAFLALMKNRFRGRGIYLMDEPEAALSPMRQLAFLSLLDDLVRRRQSQCIIATHSPIIMAYPHARILQFDGTGVKRVAYEDTEHYQVTATFMKNPASYLKHLLSDDE